MDMAWWQWVLLAVAVYAVGAWLTHHIRFWLCVWDIGEMQAEEACAQEFAVFLWPLWWSSMVVAWLIGAPLLLAARRIEDTPDRVNEKRKAIAAAKERGPAPNPEKWRLFPIPTQGRDE
jgi:hypothetical protein